MSANAVENALWRALSHPTDLAAFQQDGNRYLARFTLTDHERSLLLSWDVNAIIEHGVNPVLLMLTFGAVNGRHRRPEYLAKIAGTWRQDPVAGK
jgi:Aromatic-ring-opening dioxygenase LigAB, LigA subunit